MASLTNIEDNLYAPPQANCLHDEEPAIVLRRAVVIFRRMGWGGALLFGAASAMNVAINLSSTNPEFLVPMIVLGGYTIFFWSMVKIARSLKKDFDGAYRRARWTAIIAGTFYFPFLTIPCYFAIRHMEEYRRRYAVKHVALDTSTESPESVSR